YPQPGGGVATAGSPRRVPLGLFGLLFGGRCLCIGDQFLDLLAAFVANLLVKVRAVFFFDDFAALLPDRLIKLGAVTFPCRLPALTSDLFVEPGTIAVANGVATLFPSFPDGHLAFDLGSLRRFYRRRLFIVRHDLLGDFS